MKSRSKVSTMHLWPVRVSNVIGVMNWVAFLVMMTSTSAPQLAQCAGHVGHFIGGNAAADAQKDAFSLQIHPKYLL